MLDTEALTLQQLDNQQLPCDNLTVSPVVLTHNQSSGFIVQAVQHNSDLPPQVVTQAEEHRG